MLPAEMDWELVLVPSPTLTTELVGVRVFEETFVDDWARDRT
jgi:hypothetical protein